MEKSSMKDKVKSGFREVLIDAILETAKRILHIETDEDGNFKSFKISKCGEDGTTYEIEAKVRYPWEEKEEKEDKEKSEKKSKVKKQQKSKKRK